MAAPAEEAVVSDGGSQMTKDLFSGAMGGIAQVMIGMHDLHDESQCH